MRKRPMIIALALAGIIGGTTAGIAAISTEGAGTATTDALTEAVIAQPAAVTAPAEVQAPAAPEVAVETITPETVAQAPAPTAPARVAATPAPTKTLATPTARGTDEERMVRIPFTNYYVRMTNPTFPSAGLESPEPLPATIAYFDRLEANRLAAAQQIKPLAKVETVTPPAPVVDLSGATRPATTDITAQPATPLVQVTQAVASAGN